MVYLEDCNKRPKTVFESSSQNAGQSSSGDMLPASDIVVIPESSLSVSLGNQTRWSHDLFKLELSGF